jgi:hypothetical protein
MPFPQRKTQEINSFCLQETGNARERKPTLHPKKSYLISPRPPVLHVDLSRHHRLTPRPAASSPRDRPSHNHSAALPRSLSRMALLASPTPFGAAAIRRRVAPLALIPAGGRAALHVALARRGGVSSRTQRRLEERGGKKRRGGVAAPDVDEDAAEAGTAAEWEGEPLGFEVSTEPMPELPNPEKPDFWEGPQWEALGFFVQYMWAFGVVFGVSTCIFPSLISRLCAVAVCPRRSAIPAPESGCSEVEALSLCRAALHIETLIRHHEPMILRMCYRKRMKLFFSCSTA